MPFDPTGNFTRVHSWQQDRDNGIRILAERHDEEDDNFGNAFNLTFLRTGTVPMTGNLVMGGNGIKLIDAGDEAAPGLTFELSNSTGVWQPNPNAIAFSSNGVKRFEVNNAGVAVLGATTFYGDITTTGNLDVGGTLHVVANATFDAALSVTGMIYGTGKAYIEGSGDVLTLVSPGAHGTGNCFIAFTDPGQRKGYVGYGGADDTMFVNSESGALYLSSGAFSMQFVNNNALRMIIKANGYIGMNAIDPETALHVVGNILVPANTGAFCGVNKDVANFVAEGLVTPHYGLQWSTLPSFPGGAQAQLSGYGGIKFYTGAAERFVIENSGNLSAYSNAFRLGQTNSGKVAFIGGTAGNTGYVEFLNPDSSRSGFIGFAASPAGHVTYNNTNAAAGWGHSFVGSITANNNILAINYSGQAITTSNPSNGGWWAMKVVTDGAHVGGITGDDTQTVYNTSCDQRRKKNIRDAKDAGPVLDQIKIRSFDWKDADDHVEYGLVAQELNKVFPKAVTHMDDYWGVDFSKLVPLLVKELQSLRGRVAFLEGYGG